MSVREYATQPRMHQRFRWPIDSDSWRHNVFQFSAIFSFMSKWPGGWIPWIGNATCAGLATLAVVLVVVAIVGCSVTGGDEVVEVPPVVVILGSIPPLPPYACYNSCSEWDMHTIVIWTKNLYLGKGPHNIVCHTWLSYLQIISCNKVLSTHYASGVPINTWPHMPLVCMTLVFLILPW